MSATWHDLTTLLRLRFRLLLRWPLKRSDGTYSGIASRRMIVVLLGLFVLAAVLIVPLTSLIHALVGGALGRALLTPSLALTYSISSLLIIFYAVIGLVATLTYGSDLKLLLLTPVSPRLLMSEKLFLVSLGFTPALLLTVPGLFAIGGALDLGPAFNVVAILLIFVVPIAPVSLAMIFVVSLLRWLPPARARTVTTVLGTLVGAALFISTQVLFNRSPGLQRLRPTGLPDLLPTTWPGHVLAAVGLGQTTTALGYALEIVALDVVLVGVAITLSARLFVTGWATYQEVAKRTEQPSYRRAIGGSLPLAPVAGSIHGEAADQGHSRPPRPWYPLIYKEWLSLRRDPQQLAVLFYPLLVAGFYLYRTFSVSQVIGGPPNGAIYAVLILTMILMTSAFAPAIMNREGKSLYLLALAPLSARDILVAKWAVCVTPVLLLVEGILAASTIELHIATSQAVVAGIAMALLTIAITGMVIVINLIWPRFNSDNPRRQASGIATVVSFFFEFVLGAAVFLMLLLTFNILPDSAAQGAVAGLGVFVLPGLAIALAATIGPRVLQRLLVGEKAKY